jgi:hypothetical protein
MKSSPAELSDEALVKMIYDSQTTIKNTQISTHGVSERLRKLNEFYSAIATKPHGAGLIYRDRKKNEITWKNIGDRLLVGRAPNPMHSSLETVLIIDDEEMSRTHFEIALGGDQLYVLTDLKTTNGTAVNGTNQKAVILTSGAEILAGRTSLMFTHS